MKMIGSFLILAATALLVGGGQASPNAGLPSVQPPSNVTQTQPVVASAQVKTEALGAEAGRDSVDTDAAEQGDQNGPDGTADVETTDDAQDSAPSRAPAISAAAAQQAAEAYLSAGAASKVELDDENGQLAYSIEIGASDVKVDAKTGAVLRVEDNSD